MKPLGYLQRVAAPPGFGPFIMRTDIARQNIERRNLDPHPSRDSYGFLVRYIFRAERLCHGGQLDERPEIQGESAFYKVGPLLPRCSHREARLREGSAARGHAFDESKPAPFASAPHGFEVSGKFSHDVPLARLCGEADSLSEISLSRIVVRRALRAPLLASFGYLSRRFMAF